MSEKAPCAVCGKPVIVRNVHDVRRNLPNFCSRVCASNRTYASGHYGESADWDRLTPEELLRKKV
jgi:endogenous inhibitor of DNA gyrase (YacG/DUF329 family)